MKNTPKIHVKSLNLARFLSVRVGENVRAHIAGKDSQICCFGAKFSPTKASEFAPQKPAAALYLLGGGNNVLIAPSVRDVAIISPNEREICRVDEQLYEVGAALSARELFNFCLANNLGGAEFLAQIPGQIGGCLRGNAGLAGVDMAGIFAGYNGGKKLDFAYRYSSCDELISSVLLRLKPPFSPEKAQKFAQMRANQPRGASFGSCFKNPPQSAASSRFAAGALLEAVGLRGYSQPASSVHFAQGIARRGGAGFSQQHANFLLNHGGADFDDILALILLARSRVFDEFGIMLEPEVQVFC